MFDSVSLLDVLKNSRNEFSGEENTSELFTSVQEIMPLKPVDYKIQHVSGTVKKFKASINCTISSEEEMRIFIRNYTATSKETLRQLTPRILGDRNTYVKSFQFRCHHRSNYQPTMDPVGLIRQKPSKRIKNTNCPFSLIVKLSRNLGVPSLIEIEMNHNHPTQYNNCR